MQRLLAFLLFNAFSLLASEPRLSVAAKVINSFGVELLAKTSGPGQNTVLSPYSIQMGMALIYAGASGETRAEMAKVLHYPEDEGEVHLGFSYLQETLENLCRASAAQSQRTNQVRAANEPVMLTSVNRLFGQTGYQFRSQFLSLAREVYHAPLEPVDFINAPEEVTRHINEWVKEQTQARISQLIPEGAVDSTNRLVVVDAIYLKAPWKKKFPRDLTRPLPFQVAGKQSVDVPTMILKEAEIIGYRPYAGFKVLTIPYASGQLQFLVLLPDELDGVDKLQARLDCSWFADWCELPTPVINLSIPRFKLDPTPLALGDYLQQSGMKTAFDVPRGSANFDRMAPRRMGRYLFLSQVFHKTFFTLDENGSEAAAASGFAMRYGGESSKEPTPIEVRIDHPFLIAIQHRASGACLFIGRVNDPRSW